MSSNDDEHQDADVPALALEALKAAHLRARQAGHPLVMVRDDQLIRVHGEHITVLKQVPARRKVTGRARPATA